MRAAALCEQCAGRLAAAQRRYQPLRPHRLVLLQRLLHRCGRGRRRRGRAAAAGRAPILAPLRRALSLAGSLHAPVSSRCMGTGFPAMQCLLLVQHLPSSRAMQLSGNSHFVLHVNCCVEDILRIQPGAGRPLLLLTCIAAGSSLRLGCRVQAQQPRAKSRNSS